MSYDDRFEPPETEDALAENESRGHAVTAGSMDSGKADETFRLRAIHRVVRAMNDGACPRCGSIGDRDDMNMGNFLKCPHCGFFVTEAEAEAAMKQFAPVMAESVAIFEEWRSEREAKFGWS